MTPEQRSTQAGKSSAPHELPFYFEQLGIQYTNRCNYLCAHCGTESGGQQSSLNLGLEYVQDLLPAVAASGYEQVTFTGGECLEFLDDICSLVSSSKAHGLSTKVISNGSWANSPTRAADILSALSSCGLDSLAISFDRFRIPFGGTINQVRNILEANACLSRKIRVRVYSLETSPSDRRQNDILSQLRQLVPGGDLFVQRTIPVGRARLLPPRMFSPVPKYKIDKPCYQVFSPFLDHQRRLFRCCSGSDLGEDSPLFLGRIASGEELAYQLDALSRDTLHRALAALGPTKLFASSFDAKDGFATLCHFCTGEMANPTSVHAMRNYLHVNRELIDDVYESVRDALTSAESKTSPS